MTIAACYLSPEGVVLGADSAATFGTSNHFFHEQKIFEIGRPGESAIGMTLWGLASMGNLSYRTLISRFCDEVQANPNQDVETLANRWSDLFWKAYQLELCDEIQEIDELKNKASRTDEEEERLYDMISGYAGGFCLGGHSSPDRIPKALAITYRPDQVGPPSVEQIEFGVPQFWGQPNMLKRLSYGIDIQTIYAIAHEKMPDGSPMWKGTDDELIEVALRNKLGKPSKHLPIREAIDWVYSSIYTTIKAMKFANLPPVCGGPIEIAVVTADRPFRWVRHKELDTAIGRHPTKDS